jgi:hypothetical protein
VTKAVRKRQFVVDTEANLLIVPEFSARGGVSIKREVVSEKKTGRGLSTETRVSRKVDDEELLKESRALVARGHYLINKHFVNTPIGFLGDVMMLAKFEDEFKELREAAEVMNEVAKDIGSARRMEMDFYTVQLQSDDPKVVKRLARHVRERLGALKTALLAGDREAFEDAWKEADKLEKLAVGIQSDSVSFALESAKEAKKLLLANIREGMDAAQAGREFKKVKEARMLEPIDAAIALFDIREEDLDYEPAT